MFGMDFYYAVCFSDLSLERIFLIEYIGLSLHSYVKKSIYGVLLIILILNCQKKVEWVTFPSKFMA